MRLVCGALRVDGRRAAGGARPGGLKPLGRGSVWRRKVMSGDVSAVSIRRRQCESLRLAGPRASAAAFICGALLLASMLPGCSAGAKARGDVAAGRPTTVGTANCLPGVYAASSSDPNVYRIQPGDDLAIDFYLSPEFNDEVTVGPDGKITLRLVGQLMAAGLTKSQLAQEIDQAYSSELRAPDAVVHVKNMPERQVYVEGQVNHPGAFPLLNGMTALQAIAQAGGFTDDATDSSVVLIRRDACGNVQGVKLDLASAVDHPGQAEDAMLMPRDVLVVPRSRIASVDLFVKQYMTGVLPIPPYLAVPIP